jgi:hypothetical protein
MTHGGLGVQKNIHVGGTATFNGDVDISGTCTGCGLTIYKKPWASVTFPNTDGEWTAGKTYEATAITVRLLKAYRVLSILIMLLHL